MKPVDLTARLAGKVAVITGAASGIGLAAARRMSAEGATIVVGDIDSASGGAVAEELGGLFVAVDVADEAAVDNLFDTAAATYGAVDIAFNNAGISPPDDDLIETTGLPAWQRVQDVNLTSVYLCCRAALRHMVPAGQGSIINTASFVAVMGSATSQISYTASKGGVLAMSRELGVQFARQGIRVNALCPGPVNTALLQELFAKDPERAARRLVHIPLGRFAEPEELAAAVAFLASDDASFITASTFLVDGGISSAYVTPLLHPDGRVQWPAANAVVSAGEVVAAGGVDQIVTRPGHPRSDGAQWASAHLGRLRIGQSQHLREDQRVATVGLQTIQQHPDLDDVLESRRGRGGAEQSLQVDLAGRSGPGLVAADLVDDHAAGDREQPGSCRGSAGEPGQRAQRPQEGLLGEVVGAARVGQEGDGAPDVFFGGPDELLERTAIAAPGRQRQSGHPVAVGHDCAH